MSARGTSTQRVRSSRARAGSDRRRVGGLEHRRRQAVDHDQDDRLRHSPWPLSRGRATGARRAGLAHAGACAHRAEVLRALRGSRAQARTQVQRPRARRGRAASRCRLGCRRAEARRRRAAPSRARRRAHPRSRRPPAASARREADRDGDDRREQRGRKRSPKRTCGGDPEGRAEADQDADRVPGPHPASVGGFVRPAAARSRQA